MDIKIDNLENGHVISLLKEHLADMYATSPPECVHALDVAALKAPCITFFSAWAGSELKGCVALKALSPIHGEIKSMRTASNARMQGVASALLHHIIEVATRRGYRQLSLETGSMNFFSPARNLYEKFGFQYCGPFGTYKADPHSQFMTLILTNQLTPLDNQKCDTAKQRRV